MKRTMRKRRKPVVRWIIVGKSKDACITDVFHTRDEARDILNSWVWPGWDRYGPNKVVIP